MESSAHSDEAPATFSSRVKARSEPAKSTPAPMKASRPAPEPSGA